MAIPLTPTQLYDLVTLLYRSHTHKTRDYEKQSTLRKFSILLAKKTSTLFFPKGFPEVCSFSGFHLFQALRSIISYLIDYWHVWSESTNTYLRKWFLDLWSVDLLIRCLFSLGFWRRFDLFMWELVRLIYGFRYVWFRCSSIQWSFFGAPLKLTHLDEIHDLMFSIYVPCLLSIFNVFVYVLTWVVSLNYTDHKGDTLWLKELQFWTVARVLRGLSSSPRKEMVW